MGHDEPSDSSLEIQEKAKEVISKALNVLHIEVGESHSEFIVDKNKNIHIVKIGLRMGGDCIRLAFSYFIYWARFYEDGN